MFIFNMNSLETLTSAIVLSSVFMFPSYADAQRGRRVFVQNKSVPSQQVMQAPAGQYYCPNCGSYHVNPANRGNTIGSALSDASATNLSNAVSVDKMYDKVGNAAKLGEGLKPLTDLMIIMDAVTGGAQKREKDKKPVNNHPFYNLPNK